MTTTVQTVATTDVGVIPAAPPGDRDVRTSIGTAFAVATVAYGVAVVVQHPAQQLPDRQPVERLCRQFVLALAIERLLEPFSRYLGPDTESLKQERNAAAASGAPADLAVTQAALQRGRQLNAIVVWGVAAAVGFLLCSALDITLMEAIRAPGSGQPPFWADPCW